MDVTPRPPRAAARGNSRLGVVFGAIALTLLAVLGPRAAQSQTGTDARRVAEAVDQLRRAVDPCGESGQVLEVL